PPMIGNELWMRQRVAVQKHQVAAVGARDGLVEDLCLPEALVRLTDMLDTHLLSLGPLGKNLAGLLTRAIVGKQHLVWRGRLLCYGAEHSTQIFGLVVGADDEAEFRVHSRI